MQQVVTRRHTPSPAAASQSQATRSTRRPHTSARPGQLAQ
uniref:Uncharacterized protein n=1 Tax=Arundo donax TaxID=35708 RepID=A0A0A9CDZ1_ARUDO